jgi:hypothetical protein
MERYEGWPVPVLLCRERGQRSVLLAVPEPRDRQTMFMTNIATVFRAHGLKAASMPRVSLIKVLERRTQAINPVCNGHGILHTARQRVRTCL